MNPLSIDLGNALLQRHRQVCPFVEAIAQVTQDHIQAAIISYKDLLRTVGAPESLAHSIGEYLYEVADWCRAHGHPPVNAMAVNGMFKMPGSGYFAAPGGNDWEQEIRACIAYAGYPDRIRPS